MFQIQNMLVLMLVVNFDADTAWILGGASD